MALAGHLQCEKGSIAMQHLLNHIKEPVVCAACADEFAKGHSDAASLRDFMRIDVGFTDKGIQIWCQRHDANICVIDFEGARPTADFRSLVKKTNNA